MQPIRCISGSLVRLALVATAVLLLLGAATPPEGHGDDALVAEALEAFSGAVEEVDAVVHDETASPAARLALVERVLEHWLDAAVLSNAALGARGEDFSRDEFTEFSREFERFLLGRWVGRIARNADVAFQIEGAVWNERRNVVEVRTRSGRQVRPSMVGARIEKRPRVDYWLRRRRGEWRVVNLVIDGVDVIRTFRSEYASFLERSSPAELVAELRAQNQRQEKRNPFAS